MRKMIPLIVPMLLVGCIAGHARGVARVSPCPTPSATTLREVDDLKRILADTNGVLTEYRNGLGFAGVSPNSVVGVTDSRTCSAVTASVESYLRRSNPMAENLYVVKIGPRYLALDAHQDAPAQFVLTKKFEVTHYLVH